MVIKRNTIQRRLIFDSVKELDIHPTAEQVYGHVIKKHPSISKATVYRNLSQMADGGELLNIGCFNGSVRYDHNCHKHYHFICNECKRVFDVDQYFSDIYNSITGMEGFEITGHTLTFNGLCQECGSGSQGETKHDSL